MEGWLKASFNIPLLFRVYPGASRQFALYAGPIFSFAEKFSPYERSLYGDSEYVEQICEKLAEETKSCTLCAGFDYTNKGEFLIGLHSINFKSLGLDLGWDFSKLFK